MDTIFLEARKRYDSFLYGIHEGGNRRKAKYVDNQINGIGNERINRGKHGEVIVQIRADIEHIEILGQTLFQQSGIYRDVQNQRYRRESGEHDHAPGKEAFVQMTAVIGSHIDTENDLQAVVYHRLNVNEHSARKNGRRKDHDDQTRKERERSDISHDRAAEFAILHQKDKGEGVHRRGAELERKSSPIISPRDRIAVVMHSAVELLSELKNNHDEPADEKKRAHGAVLRVAEELDETYRKGDRQHDGNDVPRTVERRAIHFCLQNVVDKTFKSRHFFFSFDLLNEGRERVSPLKNPNDRSFRIYFIIKGVFLQSFYNKMRKNIDKNRNYFNFSSTASKMRSRRLRRYSPSLG